MTQPMTQEQRADFLIRFLLDEREEYKNIPIPDDPAGKRRLGKRLPAPGGPRTAGRIPPGSGAKICVQDWKTEGKYRIINRML